MTRVQELYARKVGAETSVYFLLRHTRADSTYVDALPCVSHTPLTAPLWVADLGVEGCRTQFTGDLR